MPHLRDCTAAVNNHEDVAACSPRSRRVYAAFPKRQWQERQCEQALRPNNNIHTTYLHFELSTLDVDRRLTETLLEKHCHGFIPC